MGFVSTKRTVRLRNMGKVKSLYEVRTGLLASAVKQRK